MQRQGEDQKREIFVVVGKRGQPSRNGVGFTKEIGLRVRFGLGNEGDRRTGNGTTG